MFHIIQQPLKRTFRTLHLALLGSGLLIWTTGHSESSKSGNASRPVNFVVINQHIPDIQLQLKYSTEHNFTGEVVRGYQEAKCWITREAADALQKVQSELQIMGLSLLVFDAFRPQRAVDHFVEWAKDSSTSIEAKHRYFPDLEKSELFSKGYIADKSGHTRGSTIDLTLCALGDGGEPIPLDMGTPFDFFGEEAGTAFAGVTAQQRANRLLLKSVMEKHGFKNYPVEWWHFTLKKEPYPNTYFDFPISK